MEIALAVLGILIVIGLAVTIGLQLRKPPPPVETQSFGLLQNQFNALQERLDKFGQTVSESLQNSTASMNTRLDNAAKVVGDLREKVGQIHEVGKAAAELVNILRAPKLRGGMGELFLNDLLAQILPPEHFRLQHHFKSGDAVDAVILIGTSLVPVDSKFPLENFRRVVEAASESERVAARKQFLR